MRHIQSIAERVPNNSLKILISGSNILGTIDFKVIMIIEDPKVSIDGFSSSLYKPAYRFWYWVKYYGLDKVQISKGIVKKFFQKFMFPSALHI